MRSVRFAFLALFLLAGMSAYGQSWNLVWADEFNSSIGPDWVFETGTGSGGWGNNELQYYRSQNASVNNGHLVITARRESFGGMQYTSARMKTQGRKSWKYGKIEARIQMPSFQGVWPAFWMLGDNIEAAGWPTCGEIDVMENVGREPNVVHGTLHGPGYSGGQSLTASFTNPTGRPFADDFHVFAIEWEPSVVRWYADTNLYAARTLSAIPGGSRWVFDHAFFVLLNVAVGGDWPGNPDATTVFPQEMIVDWVRVYRR
jgi:beta-glucanase (GH16 family)